MTSELVTDVIYRNPSAESNYHLSDFSKSEVILANLQDDHSVRK